jgi:hypothetical protein
MNPCCIWVELLNDEMKDVKFDQKFYFSEVENKGTYRTELLRKWYIKRAEEKITITSIVQIRDQFYLEPVNAMLKIKRNFFWAYFK